MEETRAIGDILRRFAAERDKYSKYRVKNDPIDIAVTRFGETVWDHAISIVRQEMPKSRALVSQTTCDTLISVLSVGDLLDLPALMGREKIAPDGSQEMTIRVPWLLAALVEGQVRRVKDGLRVLCAGHGLKCINLIFTDGEEIWVHATKRRRKREAE